MERVIHLWQDKEAKIAYLTKIIDCVGRFDTSTGESSKKYANSNYEVGISTKVEVKANPMKIVAGLEPEETNQLLQLLGKVVIKKVQALYVDNSHLSVFL